MLNKKPRRKFKAITWTRLEKKPFKVELQRRKFQRP
jgi:hypothetical protein